MASKHHLVAGGAGFIGVNLCRALLARGDRVSVIDNLSRGREDWLQDISTDIGFLKADLAYETAAKSAFDAVAGEQAIDEVWHLCANSDIAAGVADPKIDLRDTFLTTFHILQNVRTQGISRLHFASTSAVYGESADAKPFSETDQTLPISNYGAMKLASEAQIRAAVESGLQRANVFRFPNVIGPPATHGVIFDFLHKLASTPDRLDVLGNGTQQKPYLHVDELVEAMLFIADESNARYGLYNIGPRDQGVSVREIAEIVRNHAAPKAAIVYGLEDRGWVGDVPRFYYSTSKLADLGWRPRLSSAEAVARAVPMIAAGLKA